MNEKSEDAPPARIDPTSLVESSACVGSGSVVWGLAHVRAGARIGDGCVIGRGAFIDFGVSLGHRCKVQNDALLYAPAQLADGVFIGPGAVLTNDVNPRAITPDGSLKSTSEWTAVGVKIGRGASIGARAVCVAPVVVGEWALVGAGAVVSKDVPAYALVVGVPARQVAWVGRSGHRLAEIGDGQFSCPVTGETYRECGGALLREGT